jgi:hypothetical protein
MGPKQAVPDPSSDGGNKVSSDSGTLPGLDAGGPFDTGLSPQPDAGGAAGAIKVTCAGPSAAVRLNSPTEVSCSIDNGGKPTSAPMFKAEPADGVVMRDQRGGKVSFSLSTGTAGYQHPVGFVDTTYRVTLEVKDAADPSQLGRGSATVTVLGNYWVGDGSSSGQGIYAVGSDGSFVGQPVGPAGITGVFDLQSLPGGDVAATSDSLKTLRVFDRNGKPQPIAFEETDLNGAKLWDAAPGSSYGSAPRQMALSSTGELWVTGAAVNRVFGTAVFNPMSGRFLRFVPTQDTGQSSPFEAIARREDGTMLLGYSTTKKIHLFDEKTYASKGFPYVDPGVFGSYRTFVPLPGGDVVAVLDGGSDTTLVLLNPTFGVKAKSAALYQLRFTGGERLQGELLFPESSSTTGDIARIDVKTLKPIDPIFDTKKSARLRGIVKLRAN